MKERCNCFEKINREILSKIFQIEVKIYLSFIVLIKIKKEKPQETEDIIICDLAA